MGVLGLGLEGQVPGRGVGLYGRVFDLGLGLEVQVPGLHQVRSLALYPSPCCRGVGWWRGTVVERRSLAGELSLSCARPAADG